MHAKQNKILIGGLVSTTVLSALFLSFPSVFADTGFVDVITIDVPVSCSLSATGTNSHVGTVQNGSTGNDIGTTNIKVTCNDNTGYALYAIGYTNDEYGYNKLHSATLGTSNDIITSATVTTGTSSWAMKLAATSGTYAPTIVTDFASYAAVPTEYTKVAYYPSSTDLGTTAIGSNLTTTYRAYISPTQPAGIYVGQVKYVLVHPNAAAAPVRPEDPSTSCDTKLPGYTYLQDINSSNISAVLSSINVESPYYLRDIRDEQPYCVAKLKDGKLWMLENLNIAGGTALSSTDTDFDSNYTLPTTDGWSVDDGKLVLPDSSTSGFNTEGFAFVYNSDNKWACGEYGSTSIPCYSYYSWDAATLGSGRSIEDDTDAPYSICPKNWKLPTIRTTDATNWQTESDFYALAHQYGLDSTSSTSENDGDFYDLAGPGTTPNFLVAGHYALGGTLSNAGTNGYYWSSTFGQVDKAYRMHFRNNNVTVDTTARRQYGLSVRCLFGS